MIIESYVCPICGIKLSTISALKIHVKLTHRDVVTRYCPICNKYYKRVDSHYLRLARKCEQHAILFYLSCNPRTARKSTVRKLGIVAIKRNLTVKEYI